MRYEFTTEAGVDVGVLAHHNGRREILVYDHLDPDRGSSILALSAEDTRTIAELLGASRVTEVVTTVQQEIEGLTIEWLEIAADSPAVNTTIGNGKYRTETGASIVAVIRGGESIPAPGPEFELLGGDVIVVVGTAHGVATMRAFIRS